MAGHRGCCNRWVLASVLLLALEHAQAQSGFELQWEAPAGCPQAGEVRASIRQLLGEESGRNANTRMSVKARALQENGHWLGTLETQSGPNVGKRTLHAESCDSVAGATALIIALMIDPEAVAAHQAQQDGVALPSPSDSAAPTARAEVPKPKEREPTSKMARSFAAPEQSPLSLFVGPTLALDIGSLPSVTAGFGGHLGVSTRHLSIEAGLADWAPSQAGVAGTAAGGTFHYVTAGLSACPYLGEARFRYGLCFDSEYDRMSASGYGANVNYAGSFHWLSLGGSALARWSLGKRLAIPIRAGVVVPLAYPVFRLNGTPEEVHRPSRISTRFAVGIDLIF